MADTGESDNGAPSPGNTEPSTPVPKRSEAPGHDLTESTPTLASSEAAPSIVDTHVNPQQPAPMGQIPSAEEWSRLQLLLQTAFPNGVPANGTLQAKSSAAFAPAFTSATTNPSGLHGPACEERSPALRSETPFIKTEPGLQQSQESCASTSPGIIPEGSTYTHQRFGSTASEFQASGSTQGKKRNRSALSHSTDDDGDDVIELFTRYDPKDEGHPTTYTSNPKFSEAEERHNKIYQDFLSIFGQYSEPGDSDIEFLEARARQWSGIDYPGDIKVGLRGASGVGKSSLLNSILGIEDAAETGDGHKACTAAVQEFRFSDDQGEANFRAEIEFIPYESRGEALENYISDFFDHHSNDIDPDDPQYNDLMKPYSTCIEALSSMFCDHGEFQGEDAIEEYMKKFSGSTVTKLKGTLTSWLNTTMKSLKVCSDTIKFSAPTALELSDMIKPFQTFDESNMESENPQPSLWPVVKVVRMFCNSRILSQGIVLTDLPGTGDTNRTRMASTNEYMRQVEYTVVVSDIKRSGTNESTHEDIVSSYKRTRQGGAALVLTRTDDVELNALSPRNPAGIQSRDVKEINRLRIEARQTNDRLMNLKAQVSSARSGGNLDDERELCAGQEQCELDLLHCKNEFYDACIRSRNFVVSQDFEKKYRTLVRGKTPLAIHCVSNRLYSQHVEGVERGQEIKMTVETTGIPELRAHLYCLPAAKKFRALEHQCDIRLDNFLCMVEMVCNVTKLKRKEDMEQIILGPNEILFQEISMAFQRFREQAIVPVLEKIKSSRERWIGLAQPKLEEWGQWNTSTFRTTLKRWGKCTNKKKNSINWNAELLKIVARDLEAEMEAFENPLETLTPILKMLFENIVDDIQKNLEGAAGPSKEALGIFFRTLSNAKLEFHRLSEDASNRLEKDLMHLKGNMLSATDVDQSFFVDNMKSTYDECFNMKGPKIHASRVRTLTAKINNSSKGPFMAINNGARKAATKLISDHVNALTTEAAAIVQEIHRMFSLNFSTEGGNTPAARAIRSKLRQEVISARNVAQGPLKDCLDECRKSGNQGIPRPRVKCERHSPC